MKEINNVLSDLTKLTKLATQGKWRACGQDCNTLCRCGRIWSVTEDKPVAEVLASGRLEEEIAHPKNWQENAKYISAACPENISMLLSYIEQLQARIKELESESASNQLLETEIRRLKNLIKNFDSNEIKKEAIEEFAKEVIINQFYSKNAFNLFYRNYIKEFEYDK